MAEMSSFYGGRQGNSIVLVKRFDGIDIPQSSEKPIYTRGFYAIDKYGNFILTTDDSIDGATPVGVIGEEDYTLSTTIFLIKKTSDNYLGKDIEGFGDWDIHDNDGTNINDTEYVFFPSLAQGMVQLFAEGAKTSTEVNYGAYVIIDTITGMANYNDPDNGKVYRRGMDINSLDGLAGAEFIGQIVGPQGETPEVDIDTYLKTIALDPHQERTYNVSNGGIVQGSTMVGSTRTYEDEIKYAWATIRDAAGNVKGCQVGFSFPTLIQEFYAESLSPYEKRKKNSDGEYYNYDLITEDPNQFDTSTGKWKHPFYQQWKIDVPHGYHGINSDNIEVVHSFTQPKSYKGSEVKVYNSIKCLDTEVYKTITDSYRVLGTEYVYINSLSDLNAEDTDAKNHLDKVKNKYYIYGGASYDANSSVIGCAIQIDNTIKYVKKEDCYMDILRYKEVDFDDEKEGIVRYFYIGDYDVIDRVTLSEDGTVTVFYTAKAQPKELEEVLRWIDTKNTKGITIDEDGTVKVYYNTIHTTSGGTVEHDYQEYPTVLDWVTETTLTADGKFTILYNNNTVTVGRDKSNNPIKGNKFEAQLNWIDYIDISEDGTVTFRWNSDTTRDGAPAYQFKKMIKYVERIEMYDRLPLNTGYEGSGDQKLHVKYNTSDNVYPISAPINYIIESCISAPTTDYPDVPYNHLLVYYSDPVKRAEHKDQWVTYPSTEVIDGYINNPDTTSEITQIPVYHVWTEWVDLGDVQGAIGGIHILKNVSSLDELKDADGNYIPPEKIADSKGNIINAEGAGWSCTLGDDSSLDVKEILCYDYNVKQWYSIGNISSEFVDPRYSIIKSTPNENMMPEATDVGLLKEHGIWLAAVECKFAN